MPRDRTSPSERFAAQFARAMESVAPLHTALGVTPDPGAAKALLRFFLSGPTWAVPGSVSPLDALFLGEMVRATRPSVILEIGVAAGCSTATLAWAAVRHAADPRVIALDALEHWYLDATRPVGCAAPEMLADKRDAMRAIQIQGACTALKVPRLCADRSVDLAFIDADHRHPWPVLDALAILDSVRDDAWILVHDTRLVELAAKQQRKTKQLAPWSHRGPAHLYRAWPGRTIHAATESGNIAALHVPSDRRAIRTALLSAIDEHPWEIDASDPAIRSTIDRIRPRRTVLPPAPRSVGGSDHAMRIALVSREFPPVFGGGIGTAMAHTASALVAAGHTVHVVTMGGEGTSNPVDGLFVHRVPESVQGADWWSSRADFAVRAARTVESLARESAIDVAEFPECEAPALVHCIAQTTDGPRVPTVVQLHTPTEVLFALRSAAYDHPCPSLWNAIAAERACIGLADAVYAPSQCIAMWAAEWWNLAEAPPVVPYPHAPHLPSPASIPSDAPRVVLYAGRLEPRKGVVPLALAWNTVAERHPDAVLMLAGADTSHAVTAGSVRRRMQELLTPRAARAVVFGGAVPPVELAALMDRASACVVPSLWENFPNVAIEAMIHARPLVVSDRGGMTEMLGGCGAGIVFRAGDPESLARALSTLLGESLDALTRRGIAGRQAIERLCDPIGTTSARISVYRAAIARAGSRDSGSRAHWLYEAHRALHATLHDGEPHTPRSIPDFGAEVSQWVTPPHPARTALAIAG